MKLKPNTRKVVEEVCSYEEVASMVHDSFYSIEAETIQNGFIKALERDPDDDDMEIQELDGFSTLDLEC